MREWQVGDPIGDGNDIGVPDLKYMGYLRDDDYEIDDSLKDTELSKDYYDKAWKLFEEKKYYDALTFINAAIRHNPDDCDNWNVKGIILYAILDTHDLDAGFEGYYSFNKALSINPENETVKANKIGFLIRFGQELALKRKNDRAIAIINEVLSLIEDKNSIDYANALNVKSLVFLRLKDYDNALKYCNKSAEINPDEFSQKLKQSILDRMNSF